MLKHLFLFFTLVAGISAGCKPVRHADIPPSVRQAFEEGNRLYTQGRYEAARRSYERVLDAGYASGALYYNLGGTYAHTGRLGEALRYYEKARPLLAGNERLRHNLRLVRSRLGSPPAPAALPLWQAAGQWFTRWLPPPTLLWLGLLGYLTGLGLWTYRRWTRTARRGLRSIAVAALLTGGVLLGIALASSGQLFTPPRAVVVSSEAALRPAPTVAADTSALLPEGALLDVLERRPNWTRVRLAGEATGWLDARTVGEI